MAGYYVREEDGTSKYILEDGSGDYILEDGQPEPGFIPSSTTVYTPNLFLAGETLVTVAGTYAWVCPDGITQVFVECIGSGGGGGASGGNTDSSGGGGGAYAARNSVPVTPGTTYTFVVGAAGAAGQLSNGHDGNSSTFTGDSGTQVIAAGGKGGPSSGIAGTFGQGGQASGSTGDGGRVFSGGDGGATVGGAGQSGDGGGASGNRIGAGANGSSGSGGGSSIGGAGGVGANGGGSGGQGGGNSASSPVHSGTSPGGGGGGLGGNNGGIIAGSGADGHVYIVPAIIPAFISSNTVLYAPVLPFEVPFISSVTVVYAPTLVGPSVINVPFISSHTVVYGIFSLFNPNSTFSGPGNGGETFGLRLNENGVTTTATLASSVGISGTPSLSMSGDSGMPTDASFVVTIDSEKILLVPQGAGAYLIRQRPMGNTTITSHDVGTTVSWDDSYDMTIISNTNINTDFTADIEGTGSSIYTGFLMAFDSSQAYKTDGSRFPLHVTEFMGVFVAGAGVTGISKTDGSQPSAIHAPETASDHCGAALTVPALITVDIVPGDVIVVRYTNPESFLLDLGPRSGAIQSWFGLKRVDTTDHDVTHTNPNGICVDTKSGYATYTGSVNTEPNEPLPSVIGIAPDASDAAGTPIPTPNPVPWLNVTLPGTDRYFTDSIHYNERGWPIGVLSCRQGSRRIPQWRSWDWHNFSYVYSGFGTDDSFAQVVINRNGMTGVLPTISLPGPQDIDGPDAVWDDGTYYFGTSWYVVLVATPYLVGGPVIGITGPTGPFGPTIPTVDFPPGFPPVVSPPVIEGGSGGDITPVSTGLHAWQIF